ncbi:hypothetical protein CONPUDRAFT_137844 [Coniophora puteana RWD-64-598 SS2]|uniref:Uncharacterized protein n=1 Tax=Coniophora puteana (strain RWD-64-598) TaxID=741705 RepID=A0A5M3MJT0_CONPW|nr:uncharacterized protein CONPUDRAFT_137844 [Coniophora puteana RWD-64-598 SS2]EIW79489.1 hypothetical protein CONPUDRAFT_137844 [Coniophora puteana RWD-64-598 SS2]
MSLVLSQKHRQGVLLQDPLCSNVTRSSAKCGLCGYVVDTPDFALEPWFQHRRTCGRVREIYERNWWADPQFLDDLEALESYTTPPKSLPLWLERIATVLFSSRQASADEVDDHAQISSRLSFRCKGDVA